MVACIGGERPGNDRCPRHHTRPALLRRDLYVTAHGRRPRLHGDGRRDGRALARAQPGCLDAESARGLDGLGITVSYWKDEASIAAWKNEALHLVAQRLGKERWYQHYEIRVAKVERAYAGPAGR